MHPKYDISLFHLRRSGGHAFCCWLAGHFEQAINFIGDVKSYGKVMPSNLKSQHMGNVVYQESWIDNARHSPDCFIHTYEHYPFWFPEDNRRIRNYPSQGKCRVNIVLVRDPLNTYASQLKMQDHGHPCWPNGDFRKYWLEHAVEFLSRGSRIGGCVPVSYNSWFSSPAYRRRIERVLGLCESDRGLQHVPNVSGIGSSFDGMGCDGKAKTMPVQRRWWQYRHDERFARIHDDKGLAAGWREVSAVAVAILRI